MPKYSKNTRSTKYYNNDTKHKNQQTIQTKTQSTNKKQKQQLNYTKTTNDFYNNDTSS